MHTIFKLVYVHKGVSSPGGGLTTLEGPAPSYSPLVSLTPCTPLSPFPFAIYSKFSWGTHTWKFLTLQAFLLRMPLWKKIDKFSFTPPPQSTLKYGSENRPWVRGLNSAFLSLRICHVYSEREVRQNLHCKYQGIQCSFLKTCMYPYTFMHGYF